MPGFCVKDLGTATINFHFVALSHNEICTSYRFRDIDYFIRLVSDLTRQGPRQVVIGKRSNRYRRYAGLVVMPRSHQIPEVHIRHEVVFESHTGVKKCSIRDPSFDPRFINGALCTWPEDQRCYIH